MRLTDMDYLVWCVLRECAEGSPTFYPASGMTRCDVYLDNAYARINRGRGAPNRPKMSRHAFAGHLSSLEREGLYHAYSDDAFGRVVLDDEAAN